MPSMSETLIMGHLGKDPELKYTQSGVAVCNFSIAHSEKWGQGDDKKEKTIWYRCAAWGKTAETIAEYFRKGSLIMVRGLSEEPEVWLDKEGEARGSNAVTVRNFWFVERKGGSQNGSAHSDENVPDWAFSGGGKDEVPFD